MIIARITRKGTPLFHGSVEIVGSPAGEEYRLGGWFPIESFSFGFEESKDEKPDTPTPNQPNQQRQPPKPPPPPQGKKDPQKKEDTEKSTVTLKKDVDMATTELMVLAMMERSHKAAKERDGKKESDFWADIHVLGAVSYKDTKDRFVYPSLLIHLEAARVNKWGINGSGDGRPSEDVTLAYDRCAMQYIWTKDGAEFFPSKAAGWNQKDHKRWPSEDDGDQFIDWSSAPPFFKKFLPQR